MNGMPMGQDIVSANMNQVKFDEKWVWDEKENKMFIDRHQRFEMAPIAVMEMKRRMEAQKAGGDEAEKMLKEHGPEIEKCDKFVKEKIEEQKKKIEAEKDGNTNTGSPKQN